MSIIEINDLSQVTQYIKRNGILLLDIDDTLIKHNGEWCPNLMFRKRLESFKLYKGEFHNYCNPRYLQIVREYNHYIINNSHNFTLSQPNTAKLFKLWNKKTMVFGFTGRGIELAKITEQMLNRLKINFDRIPLNRPYILIPNITGRSGISRRDIMYCGGYPKYKMLNIHADRVGKRIVMVDDSLSNLEGIDKLGFKDFIGLHYVNK